MFPVCDKVLSFLRGLCTEYYLILLVVLKWCPWKRFHFGNQGNSQTKTVEGEDIDLIFPTKFWNWQGWLDREEGNRGSCLNIVIFSQFFFSFSLCIDGGWLLSLKVETAQINYSEIPSKLPCFFADKRSFPIHCDNWVFSMLHPNT